MVSILLCVWKSKLLQIMRLTLFICLFFLSQAFAIKTFSQNQKLSLREKNTSIENILQLIEDKSGYHFMYSNSVVDVKRKVDM